MTMDHTDEVNEGIMDFVQLIEGARIEVGKNATMCIFY